jgi:trigger factor
MLAANPIDVPDVLVRQECEGLQKETMQRMGITEADQAPGLDSFRATAEKRVRLGLLMSAALKENAIELDQSQVMAKVDEMCEPYDNPAEIRNIYLQNQQFLGQIQNMVLEEQVVAFLMEQAKVGSKTMTFSELMGVTN